jgi:hypothetical protein
MPARGQRKVWLARYVGSVQIMRKRQRVAFQRDSITSEKRKLHHRWDRNVAMHHGSAAIVRVDMDNLKFRKQLLKCKLDRLESPPIKQAVKVVKFDHHDPEPGK